ncbi:unnamed protein product [Macrosiphum euphorbiae]|uniref:Uncharacterized protein n=1 Tax=Macrosiphum euphorbiae TaxID=13131 RepID=A0AAV0W7M6_9HEMI|nr:unnamed protein product [Macrosiphum euphorbiae]
MFKSCETNQSVSNASAKYRVSPPIWNRDIIILSSSSSCCRYFACNTYRLAMVRTQSMQSPLLLTSGSPFVDCIEPVDERAPRRTGWSPPLERRALGTGIRRALDDIMCSPPRYTPSRCSAVQAVDRRVRGGDLRDGFPIETIR